MMENLRQQYPSEGWLAVKKLRERDQVFMTCVRYGAHLRLTWV